MQTPPANPKYITHKQIAKKKTKQKKRWTDLVANSE